MMGKYSLENYCSYRTYTIRPGAYVKAPSNRGRGMASFLEFSWRELEPSRGCYKISGMLEKLSSVNNPVLMIDPKAPVWLEAAQEECFVHLLRRIGSLLERQCNVIGIMLSPAIDNTTICDAYLEAFDRIPVMVSLTDARHIRYLKEKEHKFGLVVDCHEGNWIECCEYLAQYRLQSLWERMPVILRLSDSEPGPHICREMLRWHAGMANQPLEVGYHLILRRLTFPQKISGNGALPIRFWFVNAGSAPCYQEFRLKLRLRHEGVCYEFSLGMNGSVCRIGDFTHNELIHLPELQEGSYAMAAGIFFMDGTPLNINIQAEQKDGYYELGTVEVDNHMEDSLLHAWEGFYPEGYYPLEDPGTPV